MPKKLKKKVTPKKTAKKVIKKVIKPPRKIPVQVEEPTITQAMYEKWFFSLTSKQFVKMQQEWNEKKLKIALKPQQDYDSWLNYFKELPPNAIRMLATTGLDILSTEAYAALSRWHDIISNPHRIDKIHQSGLTNPEKNHKDYKTIVQLAKENDRLGVLKATRDQIAEKLEKGAGARDTAALAREMTDVMGQIASYEKKMGPKKTTLLGELMGDMPDLKKRNAKSGVRKSSFKSRVTIEDVEGNA